MLRDSEMVSRRELRRSSMYEHCRELKMPLEHVMAVLLDVGLDWHGGFTLYRERQRPFSDQDLGFLQRLTPALASTVRNCRLLGKEAEKGELMDDLFHHEGLESVVLIPPQAEVMRTAHATELLQRSVHSPGAWPSRPAHGVAGAAQAAGGATQPLRLRAGHLGACGARSEEFEGDVHPVAGARRAVAMGNRAAGGDASGARSTGVAGEAHRAGAPCVVGGLPGWDNRTRRG